LFIPGYHSLRENLPQKLPEKPPFTAHLGNLSYDATVDTITEFFEGCNVLSVRIIEDREQNRPKGFAYAEFADLEGLKSALTRDGQIFQGRSIRIKVAEPRKCSLLFPRLCSRRLIISSEGRLRETRTRARLVAAEGPAN
jgi:RNA recognition motif-containing protein